MRKSGASHKSGLPIIFLVVSIGIVSLTLFSAHEVNEAFKSNRVLEFDYASSQVSDAIERHIEAYENAIRGARGLFVGSVEVSAEEFAAYAQEVRTGNELHGPAMGYMQLADATGSIWFTYPPSPSSNVRIGLDPVENPDQAAALAHARDTGEPVAVRANLTPDQADPWLVLYHAVYGSGTVPASVAERQRKISGYVFMAFRIDDFFAGVLHTTAQSLIGFDIRDGQDVLFSSAKREPPVPVGYTPHLITEQDLLFGDHRWSLRMRSLPAFDALQSRQPEQLIILVGILALIMLAGAAWVRHVAYKRILESEAYKTALLYDLATSEERYRRFIEQSSEGIWRAELIKPISTTLPLEDQIQSLFRFSYLAECNDAMARMYGFSHASEIVGKRIDEMLTPVNPVNWSYIQRFVTEGYRLINAESIETDQLGTKKVFNNSLVGVIENDNLVRAWGTKQDITERRRAENELAASKTRIQELINSSHDAIVTRSLSGEILSWNPAAERLYGYSEAEVVGKHIDLLSLESELHYEKGLLDRIAKGLEVTHQEYTGIRKDGSRITVSASTSPMRDDLGKIIAAATISHDITEQRQFQKQLQESESRYRLLAEERNQLLDQERAARSEVERANRIKDEFLLTLSHELRTPLNAILGWAQILMKKELPMNRLREGIGIIERNARTQAQIIDDLLDMNRIVSGKIRIDRQRVDLSSVLGAAHDTVAQMATAKGVGLTYEVPDKPCMVEGDAARLSQVAWNLLSNAVKFTPSGGSVHAAIRDTDDGVVLEVRDTGEGINPEFLPFVFDRFRQADSSTTRRQGGLGLGLSIVKQLVELHGGSVRAESKGPGKGSTFIVTLPPASTSDSITGSNKREQQFPPTPALTDLHGKKVLVVDDEKDARDLVQIMLSEYGGSVLTAASAQEALTILSQQKVDLILSDIGMPGQDGYQLIRKIRELPPQQGGLTPAIAVTAFARREDRIQSLSAGFQMHIAKPVEPAELIAAVGALT